MRDQDWRLVPVAAAAWGAAWLGTTGWRPDAATLTALTVGMGLIALAAARLRRTWTCVVVVVFTVTGLLTGTRAAQRHDSPVSHLAAARATATAEVSIRAEARRWDQTVVADGTLLRLDARGRGLRTAMPVTVLATGDAATGLRSAVPGARYRMVVRLAPPTPGDADVAVLRLRSEPELVTGPGVFDATATAMRSGLRGAVAHSPPRQAALVPSLVVGDTSGVDDDMRAQFQVTALTHLMAVSGANLTLMLSVILAAVRGLGVRGWWVRAAAVAGVLGFVVVCGQEPSVLRAAAMGLVGLAAVGAASGRRSLRALSVAALGLLWLDPWLARSAGFGLSVAACSGIVLLGPALVTALTYWAPRWVSEAVAIPLAAQLATQPIVTGLSGEVSLVGIVTNALAGPFVGPTTVLGFAAALLWWAPWLAAGPGWLAGWCAQPIIWLAEGGAALPGASLRWPPTALGVTGVAIAAGALAVVLPVLLAKRLAALGMAAVLVTVTLMRPVTPGWPGPWSAVFCDVGQGDATVLTTGGGGAALVDTGPEPGPTLACLEDLRVRRVPLLVLTHWHADHTGGAAAVVERYRPELILTRAGPAPEWLRHAAGAAGSQVRAAQSGDVVRVGDLVWTVVSAWQPPGDPSVETEGEGSTENDASVVAVAQTGDGLRLMLAGDAEPAGQAVALRAAARAGVDLRAHVLKLPHHGSSRQEPRLFDATDAVVAVASAGVDNDYGHPSAAALRLAADHGMATARTDTQGAVAVHRREGAVVVTTQRRGQE